MQQIKNKPKQYLQGWVEFYQLKFKVTPDVLIPRPESELLVDEVLKIKPKTVIDVGTGSGNIAVSIAKNLPKVKIWATDISDKALDVARNNAKLHNVSHQIIFLQGNLLENITMPAEAVVANLPYIPSERISYLDSSVKNFEPIIALDGGTDGFELYKRLFKQVKQKGWRPDFIACEIDYTQADIAYDEAQKCFPEAEVEVKKDLAKKQRILTIKS